MQLVSFFNAFELTKFESVRKIKYKKGKKVVPTHLEYTGVHKHTQTEIQLFVYNDLDLAEFHEFDVYEMEKHVDLTKSNWINLHGLNDIDIIKRIGDYLKVDNFMLSDILNTAKRTKLDEYHDTLFFNIKSLLPAEDSNDITVEQISFLLKNGILVSFQEKRSDFFTHIRERIRTHSGIVREKKADYLLFLLLYGFCCFQNNFRPFLKHRLIEYLLKSLHNVPPLR